MILNLLSGESYKFRDWQSIGKYQNLLFNRASIELDNTATNIYKNFIEILAFY